jgi:pseudaminic acid synthase
MPFNKQFKIDGCLVGEGCPPYVIAEMSANHGNDLNKAIEIVRLAKKCGANAIKIQTYTADTLTLNCKSKVFEAKGAWKGVYLYDLYSDASMPWEWTIELQKVAKEEQISLFSSPFDFSSVEFLEKLNMPAYKIASPEIIDLPFIRRVAQTGKPIIMSTGGATLDQIHEAVDILVEENVSDLAILKCTSEYPAPPNTINLKTITNLKEIFNCVVGLSDHTLGTAIPIASVGFGASIIEKHFIASRDNKTADSFFSATPDELLAIVDGVLMTQEAIGEVKYPVSENPQRSLITIKDVKKGEKLINGENFKSLRPGGGIEPKFLSTVDTRRAVVNISRGTLLSWDLLEENA